jgi:hypothetical protein
MTTFYCKHCHWQGSEPSESDASELRSDGTIDRVHVAVCPHCFHVVRSQRRPTRFVDHNGMLTVDGAKAMFAAIDRARQGGAL